MTEEASRLKAHLRNIERYEGLLKSRLNAIELQFVELRLSEERFAFAKLQFMGTGNSPGKIELAEFK